jgi:hypothetical protein
METATACDRRPVMTRQIPLTLNRAGPFLQNLEANVTDEQPTGGYYCAAAGFCAGILVLSAHQV